MSFTAPTSEDVSSESSPGGAQAEHHHSASVPHPGSTSESYVSRKLFASSSQQREKLLTDGLDPLLRHHPAPVGEENVTTTQARLHSLLSSYTEPLWPEDGMGKESDVPIPQPFRVKFKPPVPKFTKPQPPARDDPIIPNPPSLKTSGKLCYKTLSARVGPHGWEECPRRSPERRRRKRSSSAPSSPKLDRRTQSKTSHHSRALTLPNSVPLEALDLETLDPVLAPRNPNSIPDTRPPFVVRHTDPKLLSKRDFCGRHRATVARHHGAMSAGRPLTPDDLETAGGTVELREPLYLNETPSPRADGTSIPLPTTEDDSTPLQSPSDYRDPTLPEMLGTYLNETSRVAPSSSKLSGSLKSASTGGHTCTCGGRSRPYAAHGSYRLPPKSSSVSLGSRSPPRLNRVRGSHRDMVSKYLLSQPGNRRLGVQSPSKLIEEKLHRVLEECCQCRVS